MPLVDMRNGGHRYVVDARDAETGESWSATADSRDRPPLHPRLPAAMMLPHFLRRFTGGERFRLCVCALQ